MPMNKFIFDGVNKLFICRSGVTSFDVQIDLYSDWKEVLHEDDNLKYEQALRTIGGDPISASRSLGDTYFLLNGWKIRPYEGEDHRLQIAGNLFTEDGSQAVVPTTGDTNVLVEMFVSNLVDSTVAQLEITNLQFMIESLRKSHGAFGSVFYVDPVLGDDSVNNGLSPDNAFSTFNRAMQSVVDGRGDVIFVINKYGSASGDVIHHENIVVDKSCFIRGPGAAIILAPEDPSQTVMTISKPNCQIAGFTFTNTGEGNLIDINNSDNVLVENVLLASTLNTCIHASGSEGLTIRNSDISSFSNIGICISHTGHTVFEKPLILENLNIHDGVTGIRICGDFNQVLVRKVHVHDNDVGVYYDTGIEQFTFDSDCIFYENIVNFKGSGTNAFFETVHDNSGLIEQLKASQWTHSSGTRSKSYEDIITSLLSMANGKIVNSSSGVFDFYDQDNSSIVFTLVESGLERVRK